MSACAARSAQGSCPYRETPARAAPARKSPAACCPVSIRKAQAATAPAPRGCSRVVWPIGQEIRVRFEVGIVLRLALYLQTKFQGFPAGLNQKHGPPSIFS